MDEKSDIKKSIIGQDIKKKENPIKDKMVEITFKQNRKFDLHIGRNMIIFMGRETKKVPKSWIDHKDFEVVKKYFVEKGE